MAFENKTGEKCFPPLPRWPPEVYPDEAAHGFFQRLTLENKQVSMRTLATNLGLNARNIKPETFLDLAQRFPVHNRDELAAATPKLHGKFAILRGQKLRYPRDWSTRRMRVCAGCLGEQRYHRFWFDLNVFGICPIHSCQLVESAAGDPLTWWYPEVGVGPVTGYSVAMPMPRIETDGSFERYMLGRLGVMPRWSVPFLDDFELYQIIDLAEVLGRLNDGWSARAPSRQRKYTEEWRSNVSEGFLVLRAGEDGLRRHLQGYTLSSEVKSTADGVSFMFSRHWGWVYTHLLRVEASPLKQMVVQLWKAYLLTPEYMPVLDTVLVDALKIPLA